MLHSAVLSPHSAPTHTRTRYVNACGHSNMQTPTSLFTPERESGVLPVSNVRTMAVCPAQAARCSGVDPKHAHTHDHSEHRLNCGPSHTQTCIDQCSQCVTSNIARIRVCAAAEEECNGLSMAIECSIVQSSVPLFVLGIGGHTLAQSDWSTPRAWLCAEDAHTARTQ